MKTTVRTSESLTDKQIEAVFDNVWDLLVPAMGKADTEAGEILRAFGRLNYRYYNDGDYLGGPGYGCETCNPAGRYLTAHSHGDNRVSAVITSLWNCSYDEHYEELLTLLRRSLLDMMDENIDIFFACTEDMWDYREDSDYEYDEDEDWY